MPAADFSLAALYEAIDDLRRRRGLSWTQAMREINGPFKGLVSRPISRSTVTSLRTKAVAEGDGVLQMLRWLDRSPESFIPGHILFNADFARPAIGPHQILRFDTRKLHAALNAERLRRGLSWDQVAAEIRGFSAGSLMYLSKGGRTGFPHVTRITAWLGRPVVEFTRVAPW